MLYRIIFGSLTVILAFLLPWWISIIISIIGLLYFNNFYEIIFVGIVIDSLYGQIFEYLGFSMWFTVAMIIIFLAILKLKQSILIKSKI